MRRLLLNGWVLAFVLMLAPLAASAVPVTYTITGGSVTITASAGPTIVAGPVIVGFSGSGSVTFDDATPELVDITFTLSSIGPLTLASPVGGYDTVTVHSTTVATATGYDGTGVVLQLAGPPVDNYAFSVGPLKATGSFSASNSAGPPPPAISFAPFNVSFAAASGTLFVNSALNYVPNFSLFGVTIGVVPGNLALNIPDIVIKGDFTLTAAIPEPGTAALLGVGLVGLLAAGRRLGA